MGGRWGRLGLMVVMAAAAAYTQNWPLFFAIIGAAIVAEATIEEPSEMYDPDYGQKLKMNTRSTQEIVRVVYGEMKVGGNDVFMGTSNSDDDFPWVTDDDKILWIVQSLGEGICEGIKQIGSEYQIWLDDILVSQYPSNLVQWWFHEGSPTQNVDPNISYPGTPFVDSPAIPSFTDPMRNTCYMIWRLKFNSDYFLRAPRRVLVLKGRKLYDFRDATTAWSDNPVLALYDYMTNTRYGMGIPSSKIDVVSWTAAANYCDTKGWTLNLVLSTRSNADTIINSICSHFRGQMVWYNNMLYLKYSDLNYESSVMDIDDEHIVVEEGSGKALISMSSPSLFGTPDAVRVSFIDPDKDYSVDNVVVGEVTGVVTDFSLPGCTNKQQALDLGVYQLERMKLSRVISGTFRDDVSRLDPHDLISLSSTALGISDELMRVQSTDVRPDGLVDLSLIYENIVLYDDDYNLVLDTVFTCVLPDPKAVPPEVRNATISEELYWYRLRSFSRLVIEFDEPGNFPWFSHCEVWRSWDNVNWEYMYNVNTDFTIDPVEEGVTYYIRLRPVSLYGVKRSLANSTNLQKLVLGKTSSPSSLVSLTAIPGDLSISLYADKVADPDVELYEFRLRGWTGGVFLGAYRSPNLSLKGVKPGFFTFYCNTLGNNGVYGTTPAAGAATVPYPPKGWSLDQNHTGDYAGGTFINTERVWYNSEWFLKCSHTGGVLFGEYWSPIYDLGLISAETFLAYIEADIVVTGAGTQWQDVLYSGATKLIWSEVKVDELRWYELFALPAAPKVKMKLIWGVSPTAMDYEAERMEILTTILTAKYVQIYISIEDPASSVSALVENYDIKLLQ